MNSYDPHADRWILHNARTAELPQRIFTGLRTCAGRLAAIASDGRQFNWDPALQTFVPGESSTACRPKPSFAETCIPILNHRFTDMEESQGRPAIAIYGPRNRTISIPGGGNGTSGEAGRPALAAVEQAITAANRQGGYRGESPFELVMKQPGYANYAWGLPEDDLISFEQQPAVLALVGFLGRGEHITEAVLFRMDLPWMNVAPPEAAPPSEDAAGLIFRCWGDQPRQHRAIFDYGVQRSGAKRAAFIAGAGDDCDRHIRWWTDYALARNVHAVANYKLTDDQARNREHAGHLSLADLGVIFLWADCETSLAVVDVVRQSSDPVLIVTGPQSMEGCAPPTSDLRNVVAFLPSDEIDSRRASLAGGGDRPNVLLNPARESDHAARTYCSTQHLLAAINASRKSRAAVRRKLVELSQSAFGEEHFEDLHPAGPVKFAEFREGQWQVSTFRGG